MRLPYLASPPLTAVLRTHCAPGPARGQSRAPLCVALLPHRWGVLRSLARLLLPRANGSTVLWQKKDAYSPDEEVFYGSWTHHRPDNPPHADPTPDAAGLATGHDHSRWAGPTGPHYFASR